MRDYIPRDGELVTIDNERGLWQVCNVSVWNDPWAWVQSLETGNYVRAGFSDIRQRPAIDRLAEVSLEHELVPSEDG